MQNARILMENGKYKHVRKLSAGDRIASIDRTPNVVTNVRRRRLDIDEEVVTVKHDAWYGVLGTSGHTGVLAFDRESTPKWYDASTLNTSETVVLGLAPKFHTASGSDGIDASTARSVRAFATGFVYGAFMRIGGLRAYPEVFFNYDASSKIGDGVCKYAEEGFQAAGVRSGSGTMKRITFFDKTMWASFFALGAYGQRRLPHIDSNSIRCFASGLNTGIVASGYAGLPPLGEPLYETLYWSSLNSDKPMCYGQHAFTHKDELYNACYGKVIVAEQGVETYLWDVFVDTRYTTMECPSIIANNLVLSAANKM